MTGRYIEDYEVGETIVAPSVDFDEKCIVNFAEQYDPQAIHTNRDYAGNGPFGGLIASGFQTLAACFASFIREGYFVDVSLAGPGMDEIRWRVPVRPGDRLMPHVTVVEARKSKSKPDRGVLNLSWDVKNQDDVTVMTFTSITIIKARNG